MGIILKRLDFHSGLPLWGYYGDELVGPPCSQDTLSSGSTLPPAPLTVLIHPSQGDAAFFTPSEPAMKGSSRTHRTWSGLQGFSWITWAGLEPHLPIWFHSGICLF